MDIEREDLFEVVWSEPATSVAKHLGISDVALGKLCRRLQVPKPPRGYWARKQAGKSVRRPPLPAFIQESDREQRKTSRTGSGRKGRRSESQGPRLSPRKLDLFQHAIRHLRADHGVGNGYKISGGRLAWIDPDLAAAVLVAVGQNYRRWLLSEGAGIRAEQGLEGVATRLVEDLLPLARDRVVVFSPPEPNEPRFSSRDTDQHAVVRFTPELVHKVARLANLVREEGMAFIAHGLGSADQFWRVRWAHDPGRSVLGRTTLCVSASEAWVRYDGTDLWGEPRHLDTGAVPLERIAPVALLGQREVSMAATATRTFQEPYENRLRALARAKEAFDIAEQAWSGASQSLQPESLSRALALWWDDEQLRALGQVRTGLDEVVNWIDTWYEALEREEEALALEILGVRVGDCVSVEAGAQRATLRLHGVRLIFADDREELVFLLHGARYRKDGLPGKRSEHVSIKVPWKQKT